MPYNRLATSQEVDAKISSIAGEIIDDFPDRSPLFVALLHGAMPFHSKLMFEITRQSPEYHPDSTSMIVSTYGDGQKAGEPHIVTDLPPKIEVSGRTVVIVDDVLDKGITADFVKKHLQIRGATNIKLAVLCQKMTKRERDIKADYCGFTFDDKWLVGMGMDHADVAKEGYRWRDDIREYVEG